MNYSKIKYELNKIEKELDIKILYAVESGSRVWGFESDESDWDVRFIYIHKPKWYLSIDNKKDNISNIFLGNIDMQGWELKKALKLFRKSNPPFLEWLYSPIVYIDELGFSQSVKKLISNYFSPKSCTHHYVKISDDNYKKYLRHNMVLPKKYFYSIRPILACQWIEKFKTIPPVELNEIFNHLNIENKYRDEISELIERKKQGGLSNEERKNKLLDMFIKYNNQYYWKMAKNHNTIEIPETKPLDDFFISFLLNTWNDKIILK